MIVVDASVAVKWAVREPGSPAALDLLVHRDRLIAPDLIYAEVANVLRRKVRSQQAEVAQAAVSLSEMRSVFARTFSSAELCAEAFSLAASLDHAPYDCFYLASALRGGRLVSADMAFLTKCRKAGFDAAVAGLDEPDKFMTAPRGPLNA